MTRADRAVSLLRLCAARLRDARIPDLAQAVELFLESAPGDDGLPYDPEYPGAHADDMEDWFRGRDTSPFCYWETAEPNTPSWSELVERGPALNDWERTRAMRYISRYGGKIMFGATARIPADVVSRAMDRSIPDGRIADPGTPEEERRTVPLDMAAMLIEEACRRSLRCSGYLREAVPGRRIDGPRGSKKRKGAR